MPTIIVTPSSPTHEKDFMLAFLAPHTPPPPPPTPSLMNRTTSNFKMVVARITVNLPIGIGGGAVHLPPTPNTMSAPRSSKGGSTWKIPFIIMMLLFILLAHVASHGLAARRPHLFSHPTPAFSSPVSSSSGSITTYKSSTIFGENGIAAQHGQSQIVQAEKSAGTISRLMKLDWLVGVQEEEDVVERDFVVEVLGPAARR